MAKDYNELEQLVNDVTNIDTARMTLRWALERLNAIEKEKAELKKNLTIAEEAGKGLDIKVKALQESFSSRAKTLDEKEDFYGKLEATMALLGEGKLDIQQLLKKEAKLDHLHKELENEYQDKFADLDRSQAALIERWNQRLLGVEEQYAKRLAEAQKQYDSLRGSLEADHQSRLGALERTYQLKEKDLTDRIRLLEASVKSGEGRLEGRKEELEAEFIGKKKEVEDNYLRLRSMLETGLDDRVRSLDNEHTGKVRSLEKSWSVERERLAEEVRIRDAQFEAAQKEIAALQGTLAAGQEKRHSELMAAISEKEEAFRNRAAELEREKAAYEAAVGKLAEKLQRKESEWVIEKEKLQAEFARKAAETGAAAQERADAIVENARRDMEAEKARLAGSAAQKDTALAKADAFIKDLERALSATREEHHRELMEKLRLSEAAFRTKLREFEDEKKRCQEALARMAEAAVAREASIATEYAAKEESMRKETARRLEMERAAWQSQVRRLEDLLAAGADDFKKAQKEISELSGRNTQFGEQLLDKEAGFNREMLEVKANYEKELNLRVKDMAEVQTAHLLEALEAAKSRNEEAAGAIKEKGGEIERLKADMAEQARQFEERLLTTESIAISGKIAELETAYKAKKERLEAETAVLKGSLEKEYQGMHAEMARDFEIRNRQLATENEALRGLVEGLRKEIYEVSIKAEGFFTDMMERKRQHQDELKKMNEDHLTELHVKTTEAVAKASEGLMEKLCFAEEGLVKLQRDHMDEIRAMQDGFLKEKERLVEDLTRRESCIEAGDIKIAQLENEITRHKADAAIELRARLAEQEDKFNALANTAEERQARADKETQDKIDAMKAAYEARLKTTEEENAATLGKVTESLGERIFAAEEGMVKLQRDHMDELRAMQDAFQKEKERLVEDLTRRESCIEQGDLKIASLENELMRYRQDSSVQIMSNITEQEEKFNAMLKEYTARMEKNEKESAERREQLKAAYETQIGKLEAALQEKEAQLRSKDEDWNKKTRELAAEYSARALGHLSEQEDRFNALLKDYHARQEKLEKDAAARLEMTKNTYDAKLGELETMLQAKEGLMRDAGELYLRKQQELDSRLSGLNADLFVREQALAGREQKLNDRHLELERDYSVKAAEIEKLRIELVRVISDYKNKK